jgi:tetratricopeptide (TPR) repeat protein
MDPKETKEYKDAEHYTRLASIEVERKNLSQAIHFYTKSFDLLKQLKLSEEILALSSTVANLHLSLEDIQGATDVLEEVKPLTKGLENTFEVAVYHGVWGRAYIKKEMFDEAIAETAKQIEILNYMKKTRIDPSIGLLPFLTINTESQKQMMIFRAEKQRFERGTLSDAQQKADEIVNQSTLDAQAGEFPSAIEKLNQAIEVYKEHKDDLQTVDVMTSLITYQSLIGQLDIALENAEICIELAKKTKKPFTLFMAHQAIAFVFARLHQNSKAIEHFNLALKAGEKLPEMDSNTLSSIYMSLGNAYMLSSQYEDASDYLNRAIIIADPNLSPIVIAKSNLYLGEICFMTLEFDKAIESLTKSLKMIESYGSVVDYIENIYFLGKSYESTGKLDFAIERYNQGIQQCEKARIPHKLIDFYVSQKYARETQQRVRKEKGEAQLADIESRILTMENEYELLRSHKKFDMSTFISVSSRLLDLYENSVEFQDKTVSLISDMIQVARLMGNKTLLSEFLVNLGKLQFRLNHFDQSKKNFEEVTKLGTFTFSIPHLVNLSLFYLHILSLPRSIGPENTFYIDADNTMITDEKERTKIFEKTEKTRFEKYIRENAISCLRVGDMFNNRKGREYAKKSYDDALILFKEIDDKEGIEKTNSKVV